MTKRRVQICDQGVVFIRFGGQIFEGSPFKSLHSFSARCDCLRRQKDIPSRSFASSMTPNSVQDILDLPVYLRACPLFGREATLTQIPQPPSAIGKNNVKETLICFRRSQNDRCFWFIAISRYIADVSARSDFGKESWN